MTEQAIESLSHIIPASSFFFFLKHILNRCGTSVVNGSKTLPVFLKDVSQQHCLLLFVKRIHHKHLFHPSKERVSQIFVVEKNQAGLFQSHILCQVCLRCCHWCTFTKDSVYNAEYDLDRLCQVMKWVISGSFLTLENYHRVNSFRSQYI